MRIIASILWILILLTGCSKENNILDEAISLRNKLQDSDGCSFRTEITADYGEDVYMFAMDCTTDREGNLFFVVNEPASIAGITGRIDSEGGAITFDDAVLVFQTIADGQVSPVSAPWILIKTLRSGYLQGCSKSEDGLLISIDDSYQENALHLNICTDKDFRPLSGEIFWQGRRVLSVNIEDFVYM